MIWLDHAPNAGRACVKSGAVKFSNDQFFDLGNFDESAKWIGLNSVKRLV
jgi:hypothetical protein